MPEDLINSPISVLLPAFNGAPTALAPERENELRELIRQKNIHFQLDETTHGMRFEGGLLFGGMGLVYVGLRGLERLWAHTYGVIQVYRRFQATGFAQPLLMSATEEGRVAGLLLDWAIDGEVNGNPAAWPVDLPHPEANPQDDQGKLTNELFLGLVGFAVLHEIGHIVREHQGNEIPKDVKYRHEFEADEWAYDWVMDKWREYTPNVPQIQAGDPRIFKKRCTLIAGLFSLIAINHVRLPRNLEQSSHPHSIDRLLRFLVKHANEQNGADSGLAWGLASTAINLHLSQISNVSWPAFDDFRGHLNEVRRIFPRL